MDAHGCFAHLSQALSHHPEEGGHHPHSTQRQIRLEHFLQYPLNYGLKLYCTIKTKGSLKGAVKKFGERLFVVLTVEPSLLLSFHVNFLRSIAFHISKHEHAVN